MKRNETMPHYDYALILATIKKRNYTRKPDKEALEMEKTIIHGLENNWRMHWIADEIGMTPQDFLRHYYKLDIDQGPYLTDKPE